MSVREFSQENVSERNFTLLGVGTWRTFDFMVMEKWNGCTSAFRQHSSPV